MSEFEHWIVTHWITIVAGGLLLANLLTATFTHDRYIFIGATGLLLFWAMTVAFVMLFEEIESAWPRFLIDAGAVAFFYRLSERNRNGDRHDWAALICFAYIWLCVMDFYSAWSRQNDVAGFVAASNVIFVAKIFFNAIPAICILISREPLLVARQSSHKKT